jgi:hypothetical protein
VGLAVAGTDRRTGNNGVLGAMKDYTMKIHVNRKDHGLSFGTRVMPSGLVNAETENRTRTFPLLSHRGGKPTHRSAAEEWQPHRPQGDRSAEWWTLTAVVWDPAGTRYFLSWTVTHSGR